MFSASGMCAAWLVDAAAAVQGSDPAMEAMQGGPAAEGGGHGVPEVPHETEPLPSLSTSSAEGTCICCREVLMGFERHWKTGKCNRCFNASRGHARCEVCDKGLWNCERDSRCGRCYKCGTYECTRCHSALTRDEVRWANQCCNRCYNLWKGSTKACQSCHRGLMLPEQARGSVWCDPCREERRSGGGS